MGKGKDRGELREEQLMIILWVIVLLLNFGGLLRTVGTPSSLVFQKEGLVSALNLIALALLFKHYLISKGR